MVAISLYRGNLHRVPDVPRRWLVPAPKISLKDFKTLLTRRNRALSRLRSTHISVTLNPNSTSKQPPDTPKPNGSSIQPQLEDTKVGNLREEEGNVRNEEIVDQGKLDGEDCSMKPVAEAEVAPEKAFDAVDDDGKLRASDVVEKSAEPTNPNAQVLKSENFNFLLNFRKKKNLILVYC